MFKDKKIHKEVIANQILGIIIGWCIVYFLFPLFDDLEQSLVATISTVLFFVASYVRIYIIRSYYGKL